MNRLSSGGYLRPYHRSPFATSQEKYFKKVATLSKYGFCGSQPSNDNEFSLQPFSFPSQGCGTGILRCKKIGEPIPAKPS